MNFSDTFTTDSLLNEDELIMIKIMGSKVEVISVNLKPLQGMISPGPWIDFHEIVSLERFYLAM